MKITILNGNPDPANREFDDYLADIQRELVQSGHSLTVLTLRELNLRYCVGCFGCWVKTPGECITPDDGPRVLAEEIASDFVLWASPLILGFPSALLKKMLDKSIPLIHPYFAVVNGEAHHRPRYARYPRLGLLLGPEPATTQADLDLCADIFARTALNMKSQLEFVHTTAAPAAKTARAILTGTRTPVVYARGLPALPGETIRPPERITFFNGSPRGKKGNTPLLAGRFLDGFADLPGRSSESHDLVVLRDPEAARETFADAQCVLVGFPLYTDAMPGIVKAFMETLAPLAGRPANPPILFLVQSGFPEAAHSRHVERYLAGFARRLGSPYLGTIVKGGAEGIQTMPENMTSGLFATLTRLGRGFAESGSLDKALLKRLASPERYPAILAPVFELFVRLPVASFYWDNQLKQNGAFEKRFARPYEPK